MPDYYTMYLKLFAAQADAIDGLLEITENLIKAHRQVEEMYMDDPETAIIVLKHDNNETNDCY